MSKAAELANLIGNINAGGGGVNRNLIINGAMNVSQRGTSFADPANDTYTLDRFIARKSNDGAVTITQDSSGPSGFENSLKVDVTTADTSLGTSQFSMVQHKIEAQNLQGLAFGTSDAKNFTLSFYVKSNKTGTYAVNIAQSDNSSKQATLTYTIDSANTWERKSVTFTGDTSGVINDDNGSGFGILWWLVAGSDFTSGSASATFQTYANANAAAGQAVNVLDSTDNTWFLTGVQLEVGQHPTSFEHEPYDKTLKKCQRYFERISLINGQQYLGYSGSTAVAHASILLHRKRSTPTVTLPTTGTSTNQASFLDGNGSYTTPGSHSALYLNEERFTVRASSYSGLDDDTVSALYSNGSTNYDVDAEL